MDWRELEPWNLGATGLMLVATVLALVAGGTAWGTLEADGIYAEAHISEAQFDIDGLPPFSSSWDDSRWDDADGIGMVRTAGTLHLVGWITGIVATATAGLALFVRGVQLPALAGIMASIAMLCLLVATILFPLGVDAAVAWFEEENNAELGDVAWGGLALPIIATSIALLGTVSTWVASRHDF